MVKKKMTERWMSVTAANLGDVVGRDGLGGEAAGSHHHVVALLPQAGRADTGHLDGEDDDDDDDDDDEDNEDIKDQDDLAPDVVPVELLLLETPQGGHVLIDGVHIDVALHHTVVITTNYTTFLTLHWMEAEIIPLLEPAAKSRI